MAFGCREISVYTKRIIERVKKEVPLCPLEIYELRTKGVFKQRVASTVDENIHFLQRWRDENPRKEFLRLHSSSGQLEVLFCTIILQFFSSSVLQFALFILHSPISRFFQFPKLFFSSSVRSNMYFREKTCFERKRIDVKVFRGDIRFSFSG